MGLRVQGLGRRVAWALTAGSLAVPAAALAHNDPLNVEPGPSAAQPSTTPSYGSPSQSGAGGQSPAPPSSGSGPVASQPPPSAPGNSGSGPVASQPPPSSGSGGGGVQPPPSSGPGSAGVNSPTTASGGSPMLAQSPGWMSRQGSSPSGGTATSQSGRSLLFGSSAEGAGDSPDGRAGNSPASAAGGSSAQRPVAQSTPDDVWSAFEGDRSSSLTASDGAAPATNAGPGTGLGVGLGMVGLGAAALLGAVAFAVARRRRGLAF